MKRIIPLRQRIRQLILIISFLAFPVTMNFFSPYVVIDGASQGILVASPIIFGLQFFSALVLGRLFCGWVCPAGGLQEMCEKVNPNPVNRQKIDWIKWFIWLPWIGLIFSLFFQAGGIIRFDPLHLTDTGISVDQPEKFIIYFFVVGIFFLLAVIVGKRAGCHSICWMAPFMILGRKLGNILKLPGLRLQAMPEKCTNCQTCTTNCPMSLDVNGMVQARSMEHSECIFCGSCVDGCSKKAIKYQFSRDFEQ